MAIALDSNIFIYWFERNTEFFEQSRQLITQLHEGQLEGVCSTLVYTETFRGTTAVFDALTSIQHLTLIPMDERIARLAGRLRHANGIKAPDAIHIATAISVGAERFITNDRALAKLKIPELQIESLR